MFGNRAALLTLTGLVTTIASCTPQPPQPQPRPVSEFARLVAMLEDADPHTRIRAVRALGKRKDVRAIRAVGRAALRDGDLRVRRLAVRTLGAHGNRAALKGLLAVFRAKKPRVEAALLRALSNMPPNLIQGRKHLAEWGVVELYSADAARSAAAHRLLVALGGVAVLRLLHLVGQEEKIPFSVCEARACRTLMALGARAMPVLLNAIKAHKKVLVHEENETPAERKARVWSRQSDQFVKIKIRGHIALTVVIALGARAVPTLIRQLRRGPLVRDIAKISLEAIGEAGAPVLIRILSRGDDRARVAAANLLGRCGGAAAARALETALKDRSGRIRLAAAQSLALRHTRAASASLSRLLDRGSSAERLAIVRGLVGSKKLKQTTPLLVRALASTDTAAAVLATWALGDPRRTATVPALARALHARPIALRVAAARALGRTYRAEAAPHLVKLLRRTTPMRLQVAAATWLGFLKGRLAYVALRKAARGRNQKLAAVAVGVLGASWPKKSRALLKRLSGARQKRVAAAARLALRGYLPGLRRIGVPACDRFIRLWACYYRKRPAAASAYQLNYWKAHMKSIRKWLSGGPHPVAIHKICRRYLNAWTDDLRKKPLYKSCL